MKKYLILGFVTCILFWVGTASAIPITGVQVEPVNSDFPSTNADNYTNDDPYVLFVSNTLNSITLDFFNTTGFATVDFDVVIDSLLNPLEPDVVPGTNSSQQVTFNATSSVFVRFRTGPEGDWRWNWTEWQVASADVPEPSTLALFGIGLAGLGFTRRRKKTQPFSQ